MSDLTTLKAKCDKAFRDGDWEHNVDREAVESYIHDLEKQVADHKSDIDKIFNMFITVEQKDKMKSYHSRAFKLMEKGKSFLVISETSPTTRMYIKITMALTINK